MGFPRGAGVKFEIIQFMGSTCRAWARAHVLDLGIQIPISAGDGLSFEIHLALDHVLVSVYSAYHFVAKEP